MKVFKYVSCRNSDHSEALAEVECIGGLFEELTNPNFSIVEWAARGSQISEPWSLDSRTFVGR